MSAHHTHTDTHTRQLISGTLWMIFLSQEQTRSPGAETTRQTVKNTKKKASKGRKKKQNPKMTENSQKVNAIRDNILNRNISRFTEKKRTKEIKRMTEQLYNITNKTLINME